MMRTFIVSAITKTMAGNPGFRDLYAVAAADEHHALDALAGSLNAKREAVDASVDGIAECPPSLADYFALKNGGVVNFLTLTAP